jgi:addiction module RelE/StbE family toxin
MELEWRPMAIDDREKIMDYIAQDNPTAAIELDLEFESHAEQARQQPQLYRKGRIKNTREIVVSPHYVMVYETNENSVEILRVLHTAQKWP